MHQNILKKVMVITSFKGVWIFETFFFNFCVQKFYWIRLSLSVKELLKLNLLERIHILLPTKTQSIFLVDG